jgi:SAM-dependent methyltransferase
MALKLEKLCSEKWTHPLILEAGSGNGLTVFLLRAMRLNAFGVDIDPNLADYLMDKFKIPVISSHFENFDPGIEYQLIYSSHVIEHTLNPYKFMKKAYNLLEIGGIFFLDTPDTYYFDKEETRWHHFDTRNPFEHCCLLAKEGITHLAKEIGFKIDSITRYDEYQSQQAILVKV